jgi:hypothetical protein
MLVSVQRRRDQGRTTIRVDENDWARMSFDRLPRVSEQDIARLLLFLQ